MRQWSCKILKVARTNAIMPNGVELKGKRVLVVGLARTGVATALFCAARGARVTATEARPASELAEAGDRNCAPPA